MSFAIQCIQESILGKGGYANEIELISRLPCEEGTVLEAFGELIHKGLLSEEYYEGKGHKVLGRLKGNTNAFEINPDIKNDTYDCSYSISFTKFLLHEGKEYTFPSNDWIYVGTYLGARRFALGLKAILEKDEEFNRVTFTVRKNSLK